MSTEGVQDGALAGPTGGVLPSAVAGLCVVVVGSGVVALSAASPTAWTTATGAAPLPVPPPLVRLLGAIDELLAVACLAVVVAAVTRATVGAVGGAWARHLVSGGIAVSLVVALLGLAAVPIVEAAVTGALLPSHDAAPASLDPWSVRAAVLVVLAAVMTDPPRGARRRWSAPASGPTTVRGHRS